MQLVRQHACGARLGCCEKNAVRIELNNFDKDLVQYAPSSFLFPFLFFWGGGARTYTFEVHANVCNSDGMGHFSSSLKVSSKMSKRGCRLEYNLSNSSCHQNLHHALALAPAAQTRAVQSSTTSTKTAHTSTPPPHPDHNQQQYHHHHHKHCGAEDSVQAKVTAQLVAVQQRLDQQLHHTNPHHSPNCNQNHIPNTHEGV